jgi:hypothetical protein
MPTVNVTAQTEIAADPTDVASVMFDPAREPEWLPAVSAVELIDKALQPGARVRRAASALGHEVAWTTVVEAVHFPHVLTLRVVDGPFTGTMHYQVQRGGAGCIVRLQVRGEVAALGFIPVAALEGPARQALDAGLARLKTIVEAAK